MQAAYSALRNPPIAQDGRSQYGIAAGQTHQGTANTALSRRYLPATTGPQPLATLDNPSFHSQPYQPFSGNFSVQTGPTTQMQPGTHMAPSNPSHARQIGLGARQAGASHLQMTTPAPSMTQTPALTAQPPLPRNQDYCQRALARFDENVATGRFICGPIDHHRLSILRNAVILGDFEYIALHQRHCLIFVEPPNNIPTALRRTLQPSKVNAVSQVLDSFLGPNQSLSSDAINFFAQFPESMNIQRQSFNALYKEDNQKYVNLNDKLTARWQGDVSSWLKRRCPPVSSELMYLNIKSPLLQELVFRWIWHSLTDGHSQFTEDAVWIFKGAQSATSQLHQPSILVEYNSVMPRMRAVLEREAAVPVSRFQRNNPAWLTQISAQYSGSALPSPQGNQMVGFAPAPLVPSQPPSVRPILTNQPGPSQASRRAPLVQRAPAHTHSAFQLHPQQPASAQLTPEQKSRYELHTDAFYAHNHVHFPRAPEGLRFLPDDLLYPIPRTPDPASSGLHEVDKRSPILRTLHSKKIPWQYIKGFAKEPARVQESLGLVTWTLQFSAEDLACRPDDVEQLDGAPPKRLYNQQTLIWQLRSIEKPLPMSPDAPDPMPAQHKWHTTGTSWHPHVILKINDICLFPRTKRHWGKDMPVDLTPHLKAGQNKLDIGVVRKRADHSYRNFIYAVETVGFEDDDSIRWRCMRQTLSYDSVLDGIRNRLTQNDDEVAVIAESLTINVRDPISAFSVPDTPVRSTQCTHNECFDLEMFLASRKMNPNSGVCCIDSWECPICKRDARPPVLVVDKFMEAMLDELKRRGLEKETLAITVLSDGTWKPKEQVRRGAKSPETAEAINGERRLNGEPKSEATHVKIEETEVDVIELSD